MSAEGGWSRGQRGLHWLTAALVLLGFILAWIMVALPFRPLWLKFTLYQIHKTIGLLVIACTVMRLISRTLRGRPAWAADISAAQRRLACVAHAALYALLLIVPLLGYFVAATSPLPVPTLLFGMIPVPHVLGPDRAFFELLRPLHRAAAILLISLAAGHAALAIRHHRAGSPVLRRMWRG